MMKRFIIITIALLLAGCQGDEPGQSPLDIGMIKTEAVQTAITEMTVQAILNPTPLMATLTSSPVPEDIEDSDAEKTETPTFNLDETRFEPTVTPFEPVYACAIDVSASLPKDGPQPAGNEFEKTWVIRNSGNVSWTTENVRIKWVGGVNLCDQDCLDWSRQVKPGDKYTLRIDFSMPALPTNKAQIVEWGLINPANEIFCKLYYLVPYVY
jgi:hypothetical protein